MSAISLKSITGITSITTPAGVDNQLTLHTNDTTERVKVDVAGNVHINNHLAVAGLSTISTNTAGTTDILTLHADADGINNGVASIKFVGNAGNHAAFIKGGHTTNGDTILTFHTDAHASGINPEERLRITSSGNVVVGGTSLGASGSFGMEPSGHVRSVLPASFAGDTLLGAIYGVSNGFQINVDASNNQTYKFYNGSNESFRITSNGNVEIDSFNSPSTRTLSLRTGYLANANGGVGLAAKDHSGAAADGLGVYGTDGVSIHTANAGTVYERLRITTGGNVGIGSALPADKLDVHGNVIFGAKDTSDAQIQLGRGGSGNRNAYIDLIGDNTYTDYGLRLIRVNGGANASSQLLHRGTGTLSIQTNEAAQIDFRTNGNNNRLSIKADGTVLIGTTDSTSIGTIASHLVVGSTTNNDEVALTLNVMEGSNGRRVKFFLDDDDGVFGIDSTASSGVPPFVVRMATSEKLRIDTDGRLLVGTNNTGNGHIAASKAAVHGHLAVFKDSGGDNAGVNSHQIKFVTQSGSIAEIQATSEGAGGPDGRGGYLSLFAKPNNSSTLKEMVRITSGQTTFLRQNSSNEGGEIILSRASDNTGYWHVDSFGSSSSPEFRIHANGSVHLAINSSGQWLDAPTGTTIQTKFARYDPNSDSYTSVSANVKARSTAYIDFTPRRSDSKLIIITKCHVRMSGAEGCTFGLDYSTDSGSNWTVLEGMVNRNGRDFFYKGEALNHHYTGSCIFYIDSYSGSRRFSPWGQGWGSGSWELSYGHGEHSLTVFEIAV